LHYVTALAALLASAAAFNVLEHTESITVIYDDVLLLLLVETTLLQVPYQDE